MIAKRCLVSTGVIERHIYEEILPQLPISALGYSGFVQEDEKFCWMFIEDAGDEQYSHHNSYHAMAAVAWLGLMHTSGARLDSADIRLPDRGSAHYLGCLQSASNDIERSLVNPKLSVDEACTLEGLLGQFEILMSQWGWVESWCDTMRETVVHGDFVPKNIRVRVSKTSIVVLPFDWETAGWGVPAADISSLDVRTYWTRVSPEWPELDLLAASKLAGVGRLFRCLAGIYWEAPNLAYNWVKQPMLNIREHESRLVDAMRTLGLG